MHAYMQVNDYLPPYNAKAKCSVIAAIKPVFHFNRIVPKRSVFLCFLTTRVELMTSTQKKMLR